MKTWDDMLEQMEKDTAIPEKVRERYTKTLENLPEKKKVKKVTSKIENINFSNLVVLIALPFTPAFLINICAAISNISYKKYLLSIIVGKIFMVYFWGFIGLTFVECLSNPYALIKLLILLLLAYILSIITKKIMNIE